MSRRKKKRALKDLEAGQVLQGSDEATPVRVTKTDSKGKKEQTLYPPTINPVLGVNAQLLGEGG